MTDASERSVDYERSDASPKLIAALAAAVVLFLVLSPLVLLLVYPGALQRSVIVARIAEIPSPRLQPDPAQDLAALRRAEDERCPAMAGSTASRRPCIYRSFAQ